MELSIALEKPCYYPGEVLKCLVKVRRLGSEPAAAGVADELQLFFECSGSERVDPSWVGHLFKPEVTAVKDGRRLVRNIFSTGQVPLLEGATHQSLGRGREFIVRCWLPNKLPPSYRGNAVRFVYQVVLQGRLSQGNTSSLQQQQQLSCQAQSSFVVWPFSDRSSSGIERRSSMPVPAPSVSAASGAATPGGTAGGAAAAAAAAASLVDSLQDTEMIDYKLGASPLRLRWEEVVQHADGSRTLLAHQPCSALYPARTSTLNNAGQLLLAAQLSSLDSLQLDDQQLGAAAAAAAAAGDDGEGDGAGGLQARHLTPAQRASLAVRTFNLRAGDFPLLRLVLQPPTDGLLQPGGSFGLLLDFRAAHGSSSSSQQPVCLQVVALLESEEVVLAPHAHSKTSDSAAMRKLWSEQQDVTAHLLTSHFIFSIPLTAPPSFKTPMVAHRWVLRFELTLGKPKAHRPGELVTEQLLWSLPLIVFPPPPQHMSSM